ncbi:hypothetical protein VTK56DRAFT_9442 [Thermocarpiscus australiensis]
MATLPENWEFDYDGNRWFYRYKPTGLIQYTFPKPGDEFPEFVDDGAGPLDLAPEEKLVSQKQIKRRSTLGSSSKPAAANRQLPWSAIAEREDDGSPFWFQPDGLMYLGPGAYTDISPLQEEEETAQESSKLDTSAPTATASNRDATAQPTASPLTSAETTPLVASSQPATTLPDLRDQPDTAHYSIYDQPAAATPGNHGLETVNTGNVLAEPGAAQSSPSVPLLDSREVSCNPVGVVAELPSELTGQCHEELHPAPVELPGNEIMVDVQRPVDYANAFAIEPVELPSEGVIPRRSAKDSAVEQKALSSPTSEPREGQQPSAYKAVQEKLHQPDVPVRQNSLPQLSSGLSQSSTGVAEPVPGKYQPYNPMRHAAVAADSKPRPAAANRFSVTGSLGRELAGGNKRHSLAGPPPSQLWPSDVPAVLKSPQVPPKRPLDPPDRGKQPQVPSKYPLDSTYNDDQGTFSGFGPRHANISGAGHKGNSGELAHFPSVLQPARGRPILTQTPPQSHQASPNRGQQISPNRSYQAYKPYRDLQRDIEDTVQFLSKTGYGQAAAGASEMSDSGRAPAAENSAPPVNSPVHSYLAVRPHLPHSAASAPATLRNLQSHRSSSPEHSASIASGGQARIASSRGSSAPFPPSSSDIPAPLKLPRRPSPGAALQSNPSAEAASLEPPVWRAGINVGQPTQVLHDFTIATAPTMANRGREANSSLGGLGPGDQAERHQAGPVDGINGLATSGMRQDESFGLQTSNTPNQVAKSSKESQSARHMLSEQAFSSKFSITLEPSTPSSSQPHMPSQSFAVESETCNLPPATANSFAVENIDIPPLLNCSAEVHPSSRGSEGTHASQSNAPSERILIGDQQRTEADQQPAPPTSQANVQKNARANPSQPSSAVPKPAPSAMTYVIEEYQPVVQAQVRNLPPPAREPMPPTDQVGQTKTLDLSTTAFVQPAVSKQRSSLSSPGNGLDVQQVATSPPPSVTSRAATPRSPSPVSRASSPLVHRASVSAGPTRTCSYEQPGGLQQIVAQISLDGNQLPTVEQFAPPAPVSTQGQGSATQQATVSGTSGPMQPGVAGMTGSAQVPAPPGETVGVGAALVASATQPSCAPLMDGQTDLVQMLPAGHHPFASHPVTFHQSPSSPGSKASQTPSAASGHTIVSDIPVQARPLLDCSTEVSQSEGTTNQQSAPDTLAAMASQSSVSSPSQGQPIPVPQTFSAQQGATPSRVSTDIEREGSQPPMPQQLPTAGQVQLSMQSVVQTAPIQRPVSQSSRPAHHRSPETAPPQRAATLAAPAVPPETMPQVTQIGVLPQQAFSLQSGMIQHAGMVQHQAFPPLMMQANEMPGGSHVMQHLHTASSVKEEKSWFRSLWRSDNMKKTSSAAGSGGPGASNKLQKHAGSGGRPAAPHAFPPQLFPPQASGQPNPTARFPAPMFPAHPQGQLNLTAQFPPPHAFPPQASGRPNLTAQFPPPTFPAVGQQHSPVPPGMVPHTAQYATPLAPGVEQRMHSSPNQPDPQKNLQPQAPPELPQDTQNHNQSQGLGQHEATTTPKHPHQQHEPYQQIQKPSMSADQKAQAQAGPVSTAAAKGGGRNGTSSFTSVVPDPTKGGSKTPRNAGSSGWGNASGYDGSGWGDEDEDFS